MLWLEVWLVANVSCLLLGGKVDVEVDEDVDDVEEAAEDARDTEWLDADGEVDADVEEPLK